MDAFPGEVTSDAAWYERLRERFLSVARSRVPLETVEDLVQEALRIVHERRAAVAPDGLIDGRPRLAWCYQVLRNTIGNYYLKTRKRGRAAANHIQEDTGSSLTPAEILESRETIRLIEDGLKELASQGGDCERYIRKILDGVKVGDLATAESVDPLILYRRVYRCRARLRLILEQKGVLF